MRMFTLALVLVLAACGGGSKVSGSGGDAGDADGGGSMRAGPDAGGSAGTHGGGAGTNGSANDGGVGPGAGNDGGVDAELKCETLHVPPPDDPDCLVHWTTIMPALNEPTTGCSPGAWCGAEIAGANGCCDERFPGVRCVWRNDTVEEGCLNLDAFHQCVSNDDNVNIMACRNGMVCDEVGGGCCPEGRTCHACDPVVPFAPRTYGSAVKMSTLAPRGTGWGKICNHPLVGAANRLITVDVQYRYLQGFMFDAAGDAWGDPKRIAFAEGDFSPPIAVDDEAWVLAAADATTTSAKWYRFDPAANRWTTATTKLPAHTQFPSRGVQVGRHVLIASGDEVMRYAIDDKKWSAVAAPPDNVEGFPGLFDGAVVDGSIYTVALGASGSAFEGMMLLVSYDPAANAWATHGTAPAGSLVIGAGDGLVVFSSDPSVPTSYFDGNTGVLTDVPAPGPEVGDFANGGIAQATGETGAPTARGVFTGTLVSIGRLLYDPKTSRWGVGAGHAGVRVGDDLINCMIDIPGCGCMRFTPPKRLAPACDCDHCGDNDVCDQDTSLCRCVPQCDGHKCGPDGCGGDCGWCGTGMKCGSTGQCEACTGSCDGLECGDDGCGGDCGSCDKGETCKAGHCACVPDCDNSYCGDDGCGGSCGDCPGDMACSADQPDAGAWPTAYCICVPDCEGRECGDDGCGDSCGDCDNGTCSPNGTCTCEPQCNGRECGDDGCGGSCGPCDSDQRCNADGACECAPQCDGRTCGDDSCGGSCGPPCPPDYACTTEGVCCFVQCDTECGDDGCGGKCGDCGYGTCDVDGSCIPCEPVCTLGCGSDDGCGGICCDGL